VNRAVFLDRDGVITKEPPYYAHRLEQLALIAGSGEAVRLFNENGIKVVIVSNQSGIGRGYYREEDATLFNQALKEELAKLSAYIDAIYICPHHPEATIEKYRKDCDCRKPKPGMLIQARDDLNLDMKNSFVVGDKLSDIEAGKKAGCCAIIVKTGQGAEQIRNGVVEYNYVAEDLYDAAGHIVNSLEM